MKRVIFFLFPTIFFGCGRQQHVGNNAEVHGGHSLVEELKIFHDIGSLPAYLDSSISAQVSSYDTTWQNDDGFSGKYSFLRRNEDSTLVIFDVIGSGVINRIWTPTPTDDTLDFYIDNNVDVTFSIRYNDLFSGIQYPFIAPLCGNQLGGFYCYLPIPFAKGCKIVSRGKKLQFHQIQYRTYNDATPVTSFKLDLSGEEREALEKIKSLWNKTNKSVHDFSDETVSEYSATLELKPGETKEAFKLNDGGRIMGVEIGPSDTFEGLNKDVILKITWDDETVPAVYCPVADFFGFAFGDASMQSLLVGSERGTNYCYLPMPFDNSARIEVAYLDDKSNEKKPKHISVKTWYSNRKRNADTEGKFYTYWNKNLKSRKGEPHVFLHAKGKGHYVGSVLQAQGMKSGMTYFFEGDDSTAIDGKFRMHGTGSEDYFNGGWYAMLDRWEGKMSLPLHGALDYSLPFCRTGGYRFFLADKISFTSQFYHSIEHGPVRNEFPVDYTSIAFYYSNTPPSNAMEPTPELSNVFVPDTLVVYPQLMDFNIFGDIDVKTTWKYGTGGESYFLTPAKDSWLRISLAGIPKGTYALYFDVMSEPFGCDFSLWQRQTQVSDWVSTFTTDERRMEDIYTCDVNIADFTNTLTLRFRTGEEKETLVLNRIKLIRKNGVQ